LNPFRQLKRFLIYKIKNKINIDQINFNFENLNIDKIFEYFGCNKAKQIKKENGIGHGYSEFYEKHLNSFKNKKINILEIGSFAGASAASFVKYFPKATIYCLDINLTNFKFYSKNIKVFGLDVSKKSMIKKFFNKINISNNEKYFDIIIDDGSHKLSDILISLNFFFKNLRPGGIYVIEEFKYPNIFPHLNDCKEKKIDEILSYINSKKKFSSDLINDDMIEYILNFTDKISLYTGLVKYSDIAFIKKLN
jgi:predicted O-methyltransferase YrrM